MGQTLSCVLLLATADTLGTWQRADGATVAFYLLFPIYAEERAYADINGTFALLERFNDAMLPLHVIPDRENVVLDE